MLPARCSSPPCMNIEVRMVSQVDGCPEASPSTHQLRLAGPLAVATAHLARMAHLVRNRAVLHHRSLNSASLDEDAALEDEEHHHVDRDESPP